MVIIFSPRGELSHTPKHFNNLVQLGLASECMVRRSARGLLGGETLACTQMLLTFVLVVFTTLECLLPFITSIS